MVVDDEDESVLVIAVHHLDVDSGLRHPPRDLAELARATLIQSLHEYLAHGHDLDSGSFNGPLCSRAVIEEKMRDGPISHDEDSPALDVHARTTQRIPQFGERSKLIWEHD
jgi:hypothetical protein